MNTFRLRRTTLAAIALTALLSGCTQDAEDPTDAPMTEATASETSQPEETAEETTGESEPAASEPAETAAAPSTGPLEGEELSAEAVEWFDTMCVAFGSIGELAGPDTTDMSVEETQEVVVTTYSDLGSAFTTVSADLAALPDDFNFSESAPFTDHVEGVLEDIGQVYADGSEKVAAATYADQTGLVTEINTIESAAASAGGSDFGLSSLDPTVTDALQTQVTSCANLGA